MARADVPSGLGPWREVRVVSTSRGPVEAARAGAGPCVLAIHGTPGSWRQPFVLAEDLSDRFLVLSPSRPGYGRTPLSAGRTPDEQADALAALLDALRIESAAVVGISGGGPAAVAFARRYPGRTRALALLCALAAHLVRLPRALRWTTEPPGIGEAAAALGRAVARRRLASPRALDRQMARGLTPDERERASSDPRVRDDLVAFARTHLDAPAGLAGLRNDLAQARAARAGGPRSLEVAAPTLVVHGEADDVVSLSHARYHADAIPGATLKTFPGAGHVFMITRRRESSELLRGFLEASVGAR
ncbi:MAG: alpha/beta hydrolase [Acidobacteria bacterium]|nr:alpha/beta hydrolase [Acidobacteriota bacterium]